MVVTLYPPGSPYLKTDKIREPEQYNMSQAVPGRISSIVNIHNPSIEVHTVDRGINTGAAVILAAGGGHNTLNVGSEAADFVPFFYNYGVNTIILRNRLRRDGYNPQTDEVYDALQAIRLVRAMPRNGTSIRTRSASWASRRARNWPRRRRFCLTISTRRTATPPILWRELLRGPDFVGMIYPGPSPFARNRTPPPIPRNVPPSFVVCAGSGDRGSCGLGDRIFAAMLAVRACRTSKCTSMAMAAIPATPCPTAAT